MGDESGHVDTLQGRWVSWEKSCFRETVGTRVCDPMGIIEGPCGYSTRLGLWQGFVARDWDQAQGLDPMRDIEGPFGYPAW